MGLYNLSRGSFRSIWLRSSREKEKTISDSRLNFYLIKSRSTDFTTNIFKFYQAQSSYQYSTLITSQSRKGSTSIEYNNTDLKYSTQTKIIFNTKSSVDSVNPDQDPPIVYSEIINNNSNDSIHEESKIPEQNIPLNRKTIYTIAATASIPLFCFGFLDNSLMLLFGDSIDSSLCVFLGFSSLFAASVGNTLSDLIGLRVGSHVEHFAVSTGLVMAPNLSNEQIKTPRVQRAKAIGSILGMIVGCLCGMFPLLWLDTNLIEKRKQEHRFDKNLSTSLNKLEEIPTIKKARFLRFVKQKLQDFNDSKYEAMHEAVAKAVCEEIIPIAYGNILYIPILGTAVDDKISVLGVAELEMNRPAVVKTDYTSEVRGCIGSIAARAEFDMVDHFNLDIAVSVALKNYSLADSLDI